ncbi:MAG: hypothetical protein IPP72_21950 [Chitinophagaceae bacterium]|nr:hypothetical protein [Chitinophagaceae bacterium]
MKKTIHYGSLIFFSSCLLIMQGCIKDKVIATYTSFEPVYQSKAIVLQNIKSNQPKALQQTGKMVLYGNYILVNEVNKGVHVIDNTNPAAPQNIAFINIPGNVDIGAKNNMLYADIFTDMVTIDISDMHNARLKKVSYNIFPERLYTGNFVPDSSRYVVDWIKHEATSTTEISRNKSFVMSGEWADGSAGQSPANSASSSGGATGIGGSMARFTVVGNYLYTVGQSTLTSFNITDPADPLVANTTGVGWNIETIYPVKDKLFIGSKTGMFIFSIDNPAAPVALGSFSHACFDDPVIANDHYAFVTLRANTDASLCWGPSTLQRNELDIIDINNISQPTLLKVYDMEAPQGLSLDDNHLFICDGTGGLKVYDATDVMNIALITTISNINPFDVIAYNGIAIVVSKEGISQYDYSNINNIRKLSTITTNN